MAAGEAAVAGALVVVGVLAAIAAGADVILVVIVVGATLVVALFAVTLFVLRASPSSEPSSEIERAPAMTASSKRFADLSPEEARKIIAAGVASGVLQAGLLLLLLAIVAGLVLGSMRAAE